MTWLTWRQFRLQAAVVFGAIAILGVALIITGLHLRHLYDTSGIATCGRTDECDSVRSAFLSNYHVLQSVLGPIMLLPPVVTGIFWGAPLVAREFDSGTYRLAWTQSVTRTRWLTSKVVIVGAASVAASGLLSLLITWWFSPVDLLDGSRFNAGEFTERNITPLGYAAFAFAVGVVAGLLIRRTLPAMATTLAVYIGAQITMINWIRPHLRASLHASGALQPPPAIGAKALDPEAGITHPGDWIISNQILDPSGHATHRIGINPESTCFATRTCLADYRHTVTYQPANRYWSFQWIEMSIYLGLAALLVGFCFWWIRRRIA
jgi:hypothetical protein